MAIEYHLKLDGITGESTATKHSGEIEVHSWSWGASNPTSTSGTGLSAGKVSISDLNITKPVDKASAKLLELCCTGKHIATGVLSCSKSTGDKNPGDYLTIKMTEIHISSFNSGGSTGDSVGSESVSLAFAKFTYEYKAQDKDGSLKTAGTASWDVTTREAS
jgi:type VI secretion system secreted protein Hcp